MVWQILKKLFIFSRDVPEPSMPVEVPRKRRKRAGTDAKGPAERKKRAGKPAEPAPEKRVEPAAANATWVGTKAQERKEAGKPPKSRKKKAPPRTDRRSIDYNRDRNGLPVFPGDADLDALFQARERETPPDSAETGDARLVSRRGVAKRFEPPRNRNGIRIFKEDTDFSVFFTDGASDAHLPEPAAVPETAALSESEDFAVLLDASLQGVGRETMLHQKSDAPPDRNPPLAKEALLRHYPGPQEVLDLHGCTAEEAARKTEVFVHNARYKGKRTLLIIVGKGLHSRGRAVLPDVVETRLAQLKKERRVLTFEWEKGARKKSGALVVYLPADPPH